MIPDTPSAEDLLLTAAKELREGVLPDLRGNARLTVLMALAAIETAVREGRGLDALVAEQRAILGDLPDCPDAAALCAAIREGRFDSGDQAARLHAMLLQDVASRVAISNPKYLEAAEADWKSRPNGTETAA